jgi:hypothetical protein
VNWAKDRKQHAINIHRSLPPRLLSAFLRYSSSLARCYVTSHENWFTRGSNSHEPLQGKFVFQNLWKDLYELPDSSAGIAAGYGQRVGVRVPVGSRIFSSRRRPDRHWGTPSLLSIGYRQHFPRGQSSRGVKLNIHFQEGPRSRIRGSIHPLSPTSSWPSA